MARAPPVTPLYNHRPITFPPNQLLSRIKTKTKTPSKISAVHVTAMPSQQHHHEAQAQAHPKLEIIGGAMESVLPALNSTLARFPYNPFPLIGWNCHVETVYAAYFRSLPDVKLRRECIRTQDNGSVALDWVSGDDRHLPPDSPLLILLVSPVFTLFLKFEIIFFYFILVLKFLSTSLKMWYSDGVNFKSKRYLTLGIQIKLKLY